MTTPTRARLLVVAVAAGTAALFAGLAVRATAAPEPFLLSFQGEHIADAAMPEGIRHDGRFRASAPFCAEGRARDVTQSVEAGFLNVTRVHTCDDGSGSFTASMPTVRAEHGAVGGVGTWAIVEGTGRYATLRGLGKYRGTLVTGDPDVFLTITYRTEWEGVVGFDAEPPTIETFAATARALRRPLRTYVLQVGLTARDANAPISYTVDVRAGQVPLAFKRGSTASGQATVTLRIRVPRGVRSTGITLTAQDALGNETSASKEVRLR